MISDMASTAGRVLKAKENSRPDALTWKSASTHAANGLAAHPLVLVQCLACVLALISAAECHIVAIQAVPNAPILSSLLYGFVLWYWWGLAATALWKSAQKSGKDFFSASSTFKQACIGVAVAGAHIWVLQRTVDWSRVHWPVLESAGYSALDYLNLNRFFFELLVYGFIFGFTGLIHLRLASNRDKMRTLSLERQLSDAHLRALQAQIEPHFLFNTLNAVTSLVEQNRNEQALRTIQNLTSILKSTLRRNAPEKISLAQELELIDDYLSIEVTRFADRLQVDMNIDPASLDGQLPCFLLQPIVENAIRHGISRCEEGGFIEIKAERRGARLCLRVRNTTPAIDKPVQPGHGIGLANTKERLSAFYGRNYEFRTSALESGGFEVFINVPYERDRQ